ncbi:acyclic terpene utilization AtuA family protein [Haliea atlantica]
MAVTIGCAAGMWGDSSHATEQLLRTNKLNYLVFEALAEITMAILTRAQQKSSDRGYAIDIIDPVISRALPEIKRQGIKVITNAGGVNPKAAANALKEIALKQGIDLKIAVVEGDDLLPSLGQLRDRNITEMFNGTPLPEDIISFNAYLGAFPIAEALRADAEVVITGRCVDSALALGPLIYEFGWQPSDYDKLARGSLAGHLLECTSQATGGLITDWASVPSWVESAFPIVECESDGNFTITIAEGTDGTVNTKTVTEQILYEIGDPRAYHLPDVVCDFSQVAVEQLERDRVRVTSATGRAPTSFLKACAHQQEGYRMSSMFFIVGPNSNQRARRVGEQMLERVRRALKRDGFSDFEKCLVEVVGAEQCYGPHSRVDNCREVLLRVSVHHMDKAALVLVAKEFPAAGLSTAQGISGGGMGRPSPTPYIRLHSFLVEKSMVEARVFIEGEELSLPGHDRALCEENMFPEDWIPECAAVTHTQNTVKMPLMAVAYARSGDKGDGANIGLAARHEDFYPLLVSQITADKVKRYFTHLVEGEVKRYFLPKLYAVNYVMTEALGGGGTASLRFDPQGKGYGGMLLDMELEVPLSLMDHPDLVHNVS